MSTAARTREATRDLRRLCKSHGIDFVVPAARAKGSHAALVFRDSRSSESVTLIIPGDKELTPDVQRQLLTQLRGMQVHKALATRVGHLLSEVLTRSVSRPMDEVSSKPRAAAQSPEFQKRESRHEERPCEDDLIAASLEELWQQDPDGTFDLCLHSLSRTAAMMEEIVEETRADLETIEARRIAIDRTQAETRAILNEVMERMK